MVDVVNGGITAGIGAGQSNPLAVLGQFASTQNQLNQNALFQQTFRARQAMGPLAQQSVGQDGQMDWNKFATLVSSHPDTAWMAPDVLNNIAQKKLLDAETTNQELAAASKRSEIVGGTLLAAGKDSSVNGVGDLGSYMSQAMSLGGFKSPSVAIGFLADPKLQGLKGPELRQALTNHGLALMQGSNALTAVTSTFNPNMGFDPATGQAIPGWQNGARQTAAPMLPGGQQPNAGGQPAPAQVQPAAAPPAQSGELGETMAPQPQAQPAAASAPGAAPPNFQYGQPGPAQEQKLKEIETMRQGYNNTAAHAGALQQVADQLQGALAKVKTGAGASAYQEAAKFMQSLGVSNKTVDEVANGSLPAGQTAETLATQLGTMAVRQLLLSQTGGEGSAGRLTNLEFGKIVDIFPNIDNDPRAANAIFNFIRRQNTIANAKATAFNSTYNLYHAHQPLAGGMSDPTQFEPYFTQELAKRGLITQGVAKDILAPQGAQ